MTNPVDVKEYVAIRKTNDPETHVLEEFGPLLVIQFMGRIGMLSTVQLDCQMRLMTVKIDDKAVDWMLPAKFGPGKLARAQPRPKLTLGICLFAPKFPYKGQLIGG